MRNTWKPWTVSRLQVGSGQKAASSLVGRSFCSVLNDSLPALGTTKLQSAKACREQGRDQGNPSQDRKITPWERWTRGNHLPRRAPDGTPPSYLGRLMRLVLGKSEQHGKAPGGCSVLDPCPTSPHLHERTHTFECPCTPTLPSHLLPRLPPWHSCSPNNVSVPSTKNSTDMGSAHDISDKSKALAKTLVLIIIWIHIQAAIRP